MKVFVSTHPFGSVSDTPVNIIQEMGIDLKLNPYKRKIKPLELQKHLKDVDALIAGTEKIDRAILDCAPKLKLIARVGIGLDGIDFKEIKERKILVTYTPEAVTNAVAEMTLANMLNLARSLHHIHFSMKQGVWNRTIGFELSGKRIGIIGFGRVGQRLAHLLQGFSCELFVNDISPDEEIGSKYSVKFCSKEQIYEKCDIITLHVPKTPLTENMIGEEQLSRMRRDACLINTSRGGIINENDLYDAAKSGTIGGAAVDVFETEPYLSGRLCECENIILTSHSGSCSREARILMEMGAAKEVVQYFNKKIPISPVTNETIISERSRVAVQINTDWHEVVNNSISIEDNEYKLYRKKWGQYPTHFITGKYPLNVDVELVRRKDLNIPMSIDYVLRPIENDQYDLIKPSVLEKFIEEVASYNEPIAVKLGFRGDPLVHPDILKIINLVKKINPVELIITSNGLHFNKHLVQGLVNERLDVLNIVTECIFPDKNNSIKKNEVISRLCEYFDKLKRAKISSGSEVPRIRIVTEVETEDFNKINSFKSFWSHWADAVAIIDKSKNEMSWNGQDIHRKVQWACSKLWQRILITYDGKISLCNYDVQDKCVLGDLNTESLQEVWSGVKMNQIRDFHRNGNSYKNDICLECVFRKNEVSKILG